VGQLPGGDGSTGSAQQAGKVLEASRVAEPAHRPVERDRPVLALAHEEVRLARRLAIAGRLSRVHAGHGQPAATTERDLIEPRRVRGVQAGCPGRGLWFGLGLRGYPCRDMRGIPLRTVAAQPGTP